MNYQNQRKELGLDKQSAPAGSLQPLNSTMDGSKWQHNVGAAELAKLSKLADEINQITDQTAETVAKAQIRVGRLLNEARALIPGDLQFGKWREANTQITNKSTANKLMNLATQVGSGRITQELLDALPMSTLKELISAPDSVVETAIRMTLVDDAPTREEVRQMSREARAAEVGADTPEEAREPASEGRDGDARPTPAMAPRASTTPAPKAPATPPAQAQVSNNRAAIDKILLQPLSQRVRFLNPATNTEFYKVCKPLEWAFLVLGLDPDPASYPNPQVLEILEAAYCNELGAFNKDGEELAAVVKRAVKMVMAEY